MKELTYYDSAKTEEDVRRYLDSLLEVEGCLQAEPMNVDFEPGEKLMKITLRIEEV